LGPNEHKFSKKVISGKIGRFSGKFASKPRARAYQQIAKSHPFA
jgi:hypothetical protein